MACRKGRWHQRHLTAWVVLLLACCAASSSAQTAVQPSVQPPLALASPFLQFRTGPLTLRQAAIPSHPFTVTGRGGAILGMGDGTVELWQFPLKLFSGLHLRAEVDGYGVPIDLNREAATLEVSPDHTTLTYSHATLTVRQHMFVPAGEAGPQAGGVILFEVQSIKPVTLTLSLTPAMVLQWPAPQWGQPGWEWKPMGADGGAYAIATDNPEVFGLIGMPGTTPGAISPYQEHPHTLPMEFKLRFDPAKDSGRMYPLLCETARAGERNNAAGQTALQERMVQRSLHLSQEWTATQSYYQHFFDTRLQTHTPDAQFDTAMAWAELAIDKAQATTAKGETGLVAGWFPSFDSARPGFGWYFGRDTLWSLYAVNSYGDRDLAKRALEFLIRRQRSDGKMMHEFPLTADLLTGDMGWSRLEYAYAAADATPLYLLAMQDYVRTTGDKAFLQAHWESVKRAYRFERTHDSDGDGVYDNKEGTGWVESWLPKPPHQEMYLAALDRDATAAMAMLAATMQDTALAKEAADITAKLAASVRAYRLPDGSYAFSKNADGSYDRAQTIYPAVALWLSGMADADTMLARWSSQSFSTDWGTRAVALEDPAYNPISYHQGTVWPLFTGWNSMAQYRSLRPMAGLTALRQNIALTWAQDPGAVTELLSGSFYQPLGRSSSHQLWSSAMVLTPAVRGLFGVEADAPQHTLSVHPQLPATWNEAVLENVRVGDALYRLRMMREGTLLRITATGTSATVLCLHTSSKPHGNCDEKPAVTHSASLELPTVEVELLSVTQPEPGDSTRGARVINEQRSPRSLTLQVEGAPGSEVRFALRSHSKAQIHVEGGAVAKVAAEQELRVSMPATHVDAASSTGDASYTTQTVTLRW